PPRIRAACIRSRSSPRPSELTDAQCDTSNRTRPYGWTQATRLVLRLPLIDHGCLSIRDRVPGTRAVVVGLGRSEVPVHGVHEGFLCLLCTLAVALVGLRVILGN